jgi:hypothetical protein
MGVVSSSQRKNELGKRVHMVKSSEASFVETNNFEGSKERSSRIGRRLAIGVGSAAVALMAFGPLAHADEVVIFGGAGDPSGQGYENQLRAVGQVGPNDTIRRVEYPAEIGPFVGSMPMNQSVDIAVANGRNVLAEAQRAARPGEKVIIRGYSEGGVPAAILANERSGGAPVEHGTVVLDGAPVSDMSVFNSQNQLVQTFLPMVTDMMGVPIHNRAPAGSIVRSSEQDVWAMGSSPDLGVVITQGINTLASPAHAVQDSRGTWYVVMGADGIEHQVFPGVGTGGAPLGPVAMGGEYAQPGQPLAPVPNELDPRWVPNSPNFEAKIHVEAPAPQHSSAASNTQRTVTQVNKKTGKKSVVTPSYSGNFSTHK